MSVFRTISSTAATLKATVVSETSITAPVTQADLYQAGVRWLRGMAVPA